VKKTFGLIIKKGLLIIMYDEVTAEPCSFCNFWLYNEEVLKLNEPDNIKKLLMDIFSHPLITGNNEYWLKRPLFFQSEGRELRIYDGGCIVHPSDYQPGSGDSGDKLEDCVNGVLYIIKFLQKYKPKRILEIGMNAGAFSIIAKVVLDDVKIFTVERVEGFLIRRDQINEYFGEELITLYHGDSSDPEFKKWVSEHAPYELAWIDGCHDEFHSTNDIETAINNNIDIIACDDCGKDLHTEVWKSVEKLQNVIKVIGENKRRSRDDGIPYTSQGAITLCEIIK